MFCPYASWLALVNTLWVEPKDPAHFWQLNEFFSTSFLAFPYSLSCECLFQTSSSPLSYSHHPITYSFECTSGKFMLPAGYVGSSCLLSFSVLASWFQPNPQVPKFPFDAGLPGSLWICSNPQSFCSSSTQVCSHPVFSQWSLTCTKFPSVQEFIALAFD